MRVFIVVGARPNFMKAAPLVDALSQTGIEPVIVHTGQHFDDNMSEIFFDILKLPEPRIHLGVGGQSRSKQFAQVISGVTEAIDDLQPERVLTVGDVTSTAAAAVAADTCDVPVDHVEAGLRSFDLRMPEERNRRVADVLSDLLFASEPSGVENLLSEGRSLEKIHLVGNVMIDTLDRCLDTAIGEEPWKRFGLDPGGYVVVTAHRPSNVDREQALAQLLGVVALPREHDLDVVFPAHPRTHARLRRVAEASGHATGLRIIDPMDYLTFIGLVARAKAVMTDSGGLQEETTAMGVPCLTLRENTERPITLMENGGSSVLVGLDIDVAREQLTRVVDHPLSAATRPPLWDGKAATRIAEILVATSSQ